jgi:hypothetical protein
MHPEGLCIQHASAATDCSLAGSLRFVDSFAPSCKTDVIFDLVRAISRFHAEPVVSLRFSNDSKHVHCPSLSRCGTKFYSQIVVLCSTHA